MEKCDYEEFDWIRIWGDENLPAIIQTSKELLVLCLECKNIQNCTRISDLIVYLDKHKE